MEIVFDREAAALPVVDTVILQPFFKMNLKRGPCKNHFFGTGDFFCRPPAEGIRSGGYVVDTLEAVAWSLATTGSFEEALLKAVNLGQDTDTVGAIAGGLAALYYGYEAIPAEWIAELKRKEWIADLCEKAEKAVPPVHTHFSFQMN